MDFDLFEEDEEGDNILTSVYLEATQRHTESALTNDIIPEFQCTGDDTLNSQLSGESFVRNGFISTSTEDQNIQKSKITQEISLTAYDFGATHLCSRSVAQYIFGNACMNLQYLYASVRTPISGFDELSYYERRRQITMLLHLMLNTIEIEQWPQLRDSLTNMRCLLNRLTEPNDWKVIYFATSNKGNTCNMPAYHLLHGALEWKLLDLFILFKYDLPATTMESGDLPKVKVAESSFAKQLERIFDDLLTCSLYLFSKKRSLDLLYSSPFPCTCFKEMWLLLQLALQQWHALPAQLSGEELDFWSVFNKAMLRLKSKIDYFSLTLLGYCEFANWLLHALTRLHGYRSNGVYAGPTHLRATTFAENSDFCENVTQQFLNASHNEEQLRIYLCLLTPILLQWWRPNVRIPMLLWEHFHKRLNSQFYSTGSTPNNLAVTCNSGHSYLMHYRKLLAQETVDANLCSYTLFTLLIGKSLQRLLEVKQAHQAQKLLGRIYTKLSPQKFLALNELGIHHLIELFLMLSFGGDFPALAPKLRDNLLSIALDKISPARQTAVARGHAALLILCSEQCCDLSEHVKKLLQQLTSIRNEMAVAQTLADALPHIFGNAIDFRRGEILLIDAWLPHYLSVCTTTEQGRVLEVIHALLVKIRQTENFADTNNELYEALHVFVLPFLKQQYCTSFSTWVPQLAGDFCIYARDKPSFQSLFDYFIKVQTANCQALPQLLLTVLDSDRRSLIDDTTILKVWLKALVQLTPHNAEVDNLTKIVVCLPVFKFMSNLEASDILQAKAPLCVFVSGVGKNYDTCSVQDYQKRCQIADNFNSYLNNFENWLPTEARYEKSDLSFRFYSFLAIVVYNCAPIVYSKSKITCFFHIALSRFVLPASVQLGKQPEGHLAQLIHKVWPVLVQGIGRLNFKSDPYIGKTLNDLILKWTPHFKISPNAKVVARPFISCLQGDNTELSVYVFEKLSSCFLATQRRQADQHACLVVTILQEVVESFAVTSSTAELECRLESFMKATCLHAFEHIMMVDEVVPSRLLLLEFFRRLLANKVYLNAAGLRVLLAEQLRTLAQKHLAYYTFFYFELLTLLAKISPTLVADIMDFLVSEVRVVEQKRGAGADNRIRSCLQQLQECVEKSSKRYSGPSPQLITRKL